MHSRFTPRVLRSMVVAVTVLTVVWFTTDAQGEIQASATRPSATSSAPATGPQTVVPPTPQVHPDGRVTFYFPDPNAHEVQLRIIRPDTRNVFAMKQDHRGVWSVTIGPFKPEIYSYKFVADGIPLLDPGNPRIDPSLFWRSNYFEIPGPSPEPWDLQRVPHGVVHHQIYYSNILDHWSDYYVYTPPGYDPRTSRKYPVLYLTHGLVGNAKGWTAGLRANVILDNLIAQGKVRPMIVVMPLSYGTLALVTPKKLIYNPRNFHPGDALFQKNTRLFTNVLLKELIPRVQSEYRVLMDANSRAIAGCSMGGGESLLTGLNHIDKFAWIGSFSTGGAVLEYRSFAESFPSLDAASAAKLRLLWISRGESESANSIRFSQKLVAWLRSRNIPVTFVKTPGAHYGPTWRDNLIHFAPLLFQPKEK